MEKRLFNIIGTHIGDTLNEDLVHDIIENLGTTTDPSFMDTINYGTQKQKYNIGKIIKAVLLRMKQYSDLIGFPVEVIHQADMDFQNYIASLAYFNDIPDDMEEHLIRVAGHCTSSACNHYIQTHAIELIRTLDQESQTRYLRCKDYFKVPEGKFAYGWLKLTDQQRHVLGYRYGGEDNRMQSVDEVAEHLSVTREYVMMTDRKMLKYL